MSGEPFAVTEEYQAKLLAFMLCNVEFRTSAAEALQPEHLTDQALQWFFGRISAAPSTPALLREEMLRAVRNKEIRETHIGKFVGLYDIICQEPLPVEKNHIQEQLSTFIRTQAVKKAALETLTLMEQGQWEAITEVMTQAVQAGCSLTDLGTNYFQELAQRIQDRAGRRVKERIPTGIPELDSMTNGGLKKAQVGMVVGGTGRGKSIFLQWLARVAILMGKRVVYITMELPEDEIADRFDSMFARVKPFELNDYQTRVLDEVGKVGTMFGSSLIIKHYPMDTATVNTFKTFIRKLSGIGIAPDLILVDYLDLIKPHRKYNNKTDEQDAVMKGVVGMGQELNIATWTAAQLNRAGLVMETPDESAQAGSISRQFAADLVLWLAQTPDERQDELLRLVISKNRNGLTGKTISLDTDYSYMTFYREQPEVTNGAQEDGVNSEESTPVADEQRDLHVLLEQSQE